MNKRTSPHIISALIPARQRLKRYTRIVDPQELIHVSIDAAKYPGGSASELLRLNSSSTESDVSEILCTRRNIVVQGTRTSLTGGATPIGASVLDISGRDRILSWGRTVIRVQAGITLEKLQSVLKKRGRYYPPGPTFEGATVGGMIATNAAGPATFKYGQTRKWVKEIKVVLATGEVLDIQRGKYRAHENGYFILKRDNAKEKRIPVPTYPMPKVAKISAGYFAEPGMDLIDLFIGSEGTLGVITEATLNTIPRPFIHWAIISCHDDKEAFTLSKHFRDISRKAWKTKNTKGIDVCAIEYIDTNSLRILYEDNVIDSFNQDHQGTLLLLQIETSKSMHSSLKPFLEELKKLGVATRTHIAYADETRTIASFKGIREGVPLGVNRRVTEYKKKDAAITKMAADSIVSFELLPEMMKLYRGIFDKHKLIHFMWGHHSDGNLHPNIVARTHDEILLAKKILLECGLQVIKMGGSPLAEHGVGKNTIKQALLEALYAKYDGIAQMKKVKKALDPEWKLAPGNLFPNN